MAEGRNDLDRLLELIELESRQFGKVNTSLANPKQRIEELAKKLGEKTAKIDEPFSEREEEKRKEKRGKRKRKNCKEDR